MRSRVVVIGGGFIGQLVKFVVPGARVLDWRPKTADAERHQVRYFGAHYLWEPLAGIECREFPVRTMVDGAPATPDRIRAYKEKVGKVSDMGDWGLQFQPQSTGYEIVRMPDCPVEYSKHVTHVDLKDRRLTLRDETIDYDLLVSTIPMYAFLALCQRPEPTGQLQFAPIHVGIEPAATDRDGGLEINYISDPLTGIYRVTKRSGQRHYESLAPIDGMRTNLIRPGKIYPHPDAVSVVNWLRMRGVYCFGRFATWNHDELAHQTYRDICAWKEAMEWA